MNITFFPKTLICKYRKKKRSHARMCWDKMVKLNGAWKISSLQSAARRRKGSLICCSALCDPAQRLDWTLPLAAVTLRLFAAGGHAVASVPRPTCAERALDGSGAAAHRWAPLITAHSSSRRKGGVKKKGVISAAFVWRQLAGDQWKSPANTVADGWLELSALPV